MTDDNNLKAVCGQMDTAIRRLTGYIGPICDDDILQDLGLDSLGLVDLHSALSDAGYAGIAFSDFFTHYTFGSLAERIATLQERTQA